VSDYTPAKNEILWASIAQANQIATFTTETSLMGGIILPNIPAGYYFNNTGVGRTMRMRASGRVGTSSAGPNMTWLIRLFNHGTAFSAGGGILLGQSATVAMQPTKTLTPWFMDLDITMQNVNEGATSIIGVMGEVRSPAGIATTVGGAATIPGDNTTTLIATVDRWQTYDVYLSASCSIAGASNLMHLSQGKFYGEN
jgi:hypothetical protein